MSTSTKQRVTTILEHAENSESGMSDELLPLVYDELRRLAANQMAKEYHKQSINPTALVHEAYIRLVGDPDLRWDSRGHFFAAAARSMRQILINRAKRRQTQKHGGGHKRQEFHEFLFVDEPPPERLLALDEALSRLEKIDVRKSRIVMLRHFAGLTLDNIAKSLNLSVATVKRDWQFARTWLHREMSS